MTVVRQADARAPRGRLHYGYVVLAVSVLVVTGALGFGRFGYTLILPSMQVGLGLTNGQMGLIASGNFLGYLVAALIGGLLAGRFGQRLVISGGLALAGGTMLLTGLAPGFEAALAARAVTGLGSAAANVPAMSLMSLWFARRRRGLASGLLVSGSGIGLLVAGQVVPRVVAAGGGDGWRHSWYALGLAVLGIALVAGLLLRNHPGDLGLTALWAEPEPEQLDPQPRPAEPAGLRDVWRTGAIWHLGAIFAAFGFSYIIYATFFATHLLRNGLTSTAAGDLWGLVGLLSLGSGVLWGSVSDRLGRKQALAMVFLVQLGAILLFAIGSAPAVFAVSAVLFGLAGWSVPAIMTAAVGDYVDERLVPPAAGLLVLIFGVGQVVGPGVAGAIADAVGSFSPAFLLAGGIALLGSLGSLALPSRKGRGFAGLPRR